MEVSADNFTASPRKRPVVSSIHSSRREPSVPFLNCRLTRRYKKLKSFYNYFTCHSHLILELMIICYAIRGIFTSKLSYCRNRIFCNAIRQIGNCSTIIGKIYIRNVLNIFGIRWVIN